MRSGALRVPCANLPHMPDPKQQRQAPRTKGPWPSKVTVGQRTHPAQCKDVSIIGLGFSGLPSIPLGSEVKVRVELGPMWVLESTAVVVRQQADPGAPEVNGTRVVTGMRFLRLDPKTLAVLHEALAAR